MDDFIKKNHGLIGYTINKIFHDWNNAEKVASRANMSMDDLFQIGQIALWKAARKFDESKGFTFATYALKCIRRDILIELRLRGNTIRVPLSVSFYEQPKFRFVRGDKTATVEGETIFELITSEYNLQEEVTEKVTFDELIESLKSLSPKEREAVLMQVSGLTFQEIGKRQNVTRQAANVRYHAAVNKIKRKLIHKEALHK
ncbi:sigma-70 family RNA polymerase sigma factor [Fictibacillus aquaticus]|uniref:sigma-70 family RNA polymerase sigma factor n=1 Tax=Fictibacillus aquaticus TaxID=2021314 RepID=UPI0013FE3597|nr:sigma-70 family RNA polymerase sigma factor [Fictibacillus aquaticus]